MKINLSIIAYHDELLIMSKHKHKVLTTSNTNIAFLYICIVQVCIIQICIDLYTIIPP